MITQEYIPYTSDEIKAMVKTIEELRKKYNEALERANKEWSSNLDNAYKNYRERLEIIFPELKENEDEKIRKALIDLFSSNAKKDWRDIPTEKIIAWLEKQGKHTNTRININENITMLNACVNVLKNVGHQHLASWLEKQGEQTTDKIEPKFKVGDWVVQENIGTYKVIEVCESWYEVIDNQNNHYSIGFDKEDMCHLWTINDAKDGDVLATYAFIFIFKSIDNSNCVHYYCHYEIDKHEDDEQFGVALQQSLMGHADVSHYAPATKEQRDQLEKAITEAGYELDAEKKELNKIEPKFKVGDWV